MLFIQPSLRCSSPPEERRTFWKAMCTFSSKKRSVKSWEKKDTDTMLSQNTFLRKDSPGDWGLSVRKEWMSCCLWLSSVPLHPLL